MRVVFVVVLTCLSAAQAFGAGAIERTLLKLSPVERAHQACAVKGLEVLRRDKQFKGADRLMPDTLKPAVFKDGLVTAKGAALRAGKRWVALSFECTVSDDQMKATAFTYQLGKDIPPESWEEVGLWRD